MMAQKKRIKQVYGLDNSIQEVMPLPIVVGRAPTAADSGFEKGQVWIDSDGDAAYTFIGTTAGAGVWDVSSVDLATTVVTGITRLATIAETVAGTSEAIASTPAGVAAVAIAGAPNWSTTVSGIGQLATDAEAVTGTLTNVAIVPSSLTAKLAAPGAIGGTTPAAGAFTTISTTGLASLGASATIVTGAVALNLGADAAVGAINLGTGAAARVITLGNVSGATGVTVNTGTAGFALNTTGAGDVTVTSADTVIVDCAGVLELNSSAGVINIGDDDIDQAVNIATDGERTLTMGSANGAAGVVIQGGTGNVSISNNAIAHTLTLGNDTGASATIMEVGTGNFSLDGVGASQYDFCASSTTGTITIGGTSQTGTMTFGDSDGISIVQIASGEGASTCNICTGTTAAKVVSIATGAVANIVHIGSVSGAAELHLLSGTGNFTLDGAATTQYDMCATTTTGTITIGGTSGTGLMTFGDSDGINIVGIATGEGQGTVNIATGTTAAKTVNIATGAIDNVITLGNVTGTTSIALNSGTGGIALASTGAGDITLASADTVLIDGAGVVEINSSAGVIGIGNDAVAQNINLGTGAAQRVLTLGNISDASQIVMNSGTGGIQLVSTGAGDITVASSDTCLIDCAGVLELNSSAGVIGIGNDAVAQNINVGTGAAQRVLTLGNATDGSSVVVNVGTGPASFGANATAHTTTIGSTTTTSTTDIQGGTGGITLSAAGIIDVVPATNSAAGAAVTINANCGVATFTNLVTAAGAEQVLVLTNSVVGVGSAILCTLSSVGAEDAQLTTYYVKPAAGSFSLRYYNNGAASLASDILLTFWVLAA
jgi:hypothetical protein